MECYNYRWFGQKDIFFNYQDFSEKNQSFSTKQKDFWQLMSAWWLIDDCQINAWWMPDNCLMTALQLPDNCLTTAWWPPDNCHHCSALHCWTTSYHVATKWFFRTKKLKRLTMTKMMGLWGYAADVQPKNENQSQTYPDSSRSNCLSTA